jgi:hypothetical protein
MFDSLFGEGLGFRFLFAFIVVLGLIGLTAWLVRRFGGDRLGAATARGRQPRLAVIDAAAVDGRRRLILIRRDNVEHLLMIGGPTDVVIEPNIVRAAGAPRETAPARPPAATDTLPRAVPLGEGNMWPLQPEPAPAPAPPPPPPRMQRPPPPPPMVVDEPMQWHAEPEPPPPAEPAPPPPRQPRPEPRVAIDPLAGLAAELSRHAPQPEAPPAPASRPLRERPPLREREMVRERETFREPPRAPQPQPAASSAEAQFASAADQNLAEMAQRLEQALRRPGKTQQPRNEPAARAAPPPPPEPEFEPEPPPVEPEPAPAEPKPMREARAPRPQPKPAPQRSAYDSLEQEMASLLGRPNQKS